MGFGCAQPPDRRAPATVRACEAMLVRERKRQADWLFENSARLRIRSLLRVLVSPSVLSDRRRNTRAPLLRVHTQRSSLFSFTCTSRDKEGETRDRG